MSFEKIAETSWFHSIDFGDYASSGRFPPGEPQNTTLYGAFEFLQALDLSEADCLDIVAADGIASFGMSALNARRVEAVDSHETAGFLVSRQMLNLENKVGYRSGVQVSTLAEHFKPKSFDCILCAGVIYHVLYPAQVFVEPRKLLKDGGYFIVETPFIDGRNDAAFVFNGTDNPPLKEPRSYFVPTRTALTGLARLCGFRVIAERVLSKPRRITLLLKTATRAEIIDDPETSEMVVQMLKRDLSDDVLRYSKLEAMPVRNASIKLRSIAPSRMIDPSTEDVTFPYHPPKDRQIAGTTRFERPDGNTAKL